MGGMWRAFVVAVALLVAPELGRATTRVAGPDEDWCAEARGLEPGDELLLKAGEYTGSCTLTRGGAPGAPVVIRAKDAGHPPRIVQVQTDVDALSIRASYLTLNGLDFGPTLPDVDAVRILGGTSIVVENCRFADIGGVAIVATHDSLTNVVVRRNDITRTGWTAIYFGCHDGLGCQHSGIVIERNYIHGVAAPAQGQRVIPAEGSRSS